MEEFRFMLESGHTFSSLKQLQLRFEQSYDGEGDSSVLIDIIAPFINRMNRHLEDLMVWSRSDLDISDFFISLSSFSALRRFKVKMFYTRSLRNSAGLESIILNASPHLEKLSIRHSSRSLGLGLESLDTLWDMPFSQWLLELISNKEKFPRIQILDIYALYKPAGIHVFLDFIHKASDKLTEIIVRDRYLSPNEAMLVIGAASHCSSLTYLRLTVRTLDIALIDCLADKVPGVRRIYLAIGEPNPHGSDVLEVSKLVRDVDEVTYIRFFSSYRDNVTSIGNFKTSRSGTWKVINGWSIPCLPLLEASLLCGAFSATVI